MSYQEPNPLNGYKLYIKMNDIIEQMGFPAKEIINILKANSKTTCITGSFLLNYIIDDISWKPNDIDIFTSDQYVYDKLKIVFDKKCVLLGAPKNAQDIVDKASIYIQSVGGIIDVCEWGTKLNKNSVKSKSSKKKQYKIQVILNQGDVDSAVDTFDFEFVKSKYNGNEIIIPEKTMEEINTRISRLPNTYQTVGKLKNSIKREKKYRDRGFDIIYPTEVIIETVQGSPEFSQSGLKYEVGLSPSVNRLYKVNSNNKLIRK